MNRLKARPAGWDSRGPPERQAKWQAGWPPALVVVAVSGALTFASCAALQPTEETPPDATKTPPTASSPVAGSSGAEGTTDPAAPVERADAGPAGSGPPAAAEAAAGSADGGPEPPTVAVGDSFEVTIPAGYREVLSSEDIAQNAFMQGTFATGGVVMLQEAADDGAERRGVIIARGPQAVTEPAFDAARCRALAAQMARRSHAEVAGEAAVVEAPGGPACGFRMVDPMGMAIDSLFLNLDGRSFALQAVHEVTELSTPAAFQSAAKTWQVRGELRARGRGFSIPVPFGFQLAVGEDRENAAEKGAALVVESELPSVPKGRRAAIWVQPIDDPPGPWSRLSACKELGEAIASGRGPAAQAERVDVVEFDFGETCRVQIAEPDEALVRTITIPVYRRGEALAQGGVAPARAKVWVVTCTVDVRDPDAREACQKVASGLLVDG